jgi:capsule polysaccharide export protein KpsC/LpsZ
MIDLPGRKYWQQRMVRRTEDNQRLFLIWRKSRYNDVRMAVIRKMQDQNAMAVIAQCESDDGLRAEAVKRLEDKVLLRRIAKADKSDFVRVIAQKHYEYTGDGPWMSLKQYEETAQDIIEYLQRHTVMSIAGTGDEPRSIS